MKCNHDSNILFEEVEEHTASLGMIFIHVIRVIVYASTHTVRVMQCSLFRQTFEKTSSTSIEYKWNHVQVGEESTQL